jgi:hypothetical protein
LKGLVGVIGMPLHGTRRRPPISQQNLEDPDAVVNLKADLVSVFQPVNAQELFALERIALAQQTVLRIARLEAALHTSALDLACFYSSQAPMTQGLEGTAQQNCNYTLAEGFHRMNREANSWSLFLRYQA